MVPFLPLLLISYPVEMMLLWMAGQQPAGTGGDVWPCHRLRSRIWGLDSWFGLVLDLCHHLPEILHVGNELGWGSPESGNKSLLGVIQPQVTVRLSMTTALANGDSAPQRDPVGTVRG